MSYFQLERFPDALRTLRRLAACFAPALILVYAMRHDRFSGYDPVQFQEMIRFQNAFTAGFTLSMMCGMTAMFAVWQSDARNLLMDEGGSGWLSIHGWEGELDKLPQRGLLPISELLGILAATGISSTISPASVVFLPMSWSLVRLLTCWKSSSHEQPCLIGTVWLLHSAAILWSETLWLAIPFELSAIVLTEFLMVGALHRKAETMLTNDVSLVTKQSSFVSSNPSPARQQAATHRIARRLYPFSQLSANVDVSRPLWMLSVWIAIVIAWIMFCVTSRTAEFGIWTNEAGRDFTVHGLIGLTGMFSLLIFGFLRMLTEFEPFVWTPRMSLMARVRMFRPIVWSWDRILLPYALTAAMCGLTAVFIMSVTPAAFATLSFVEVLVLLRCGVTPEEWQMTADSRLASTLLSSGRVENRTE